MHVKQESLPRGRMTLRTDENANCIHLCTKLYKITEYKRYKICVL